MFDSIIKFFKELDRRIKVLFICFGIHSWHRNLPMQYNQLYATSLGATPIELGVLDSIGTIASSLISIPSGWAADRYGVKKVLLVGLVLTTIIAAIYGFAENWWILIPALLLSGASMRLVMPFVDVLFINFTRPQQRSLVMSMSRTLWAIPGIFTSMIAAIIVTHFGGVGVSGIRPLYYIQLILSSIVLLSVTLWLKNPVIAEETPTTNIDAGSTFIQDFREMFKGERWLKSWMIVMIIRNFGMRLAMPFVSLWMVNVKGADPYILGIMGTVGTLVSMLLQIPAGRLADKIGRKKAFYLFRPFTYLGTIVLILAPIPEYLILVGVLGCVGLFGGGFSQVSFIPFITMNFEMVPEEKRGRWLGILGFSGILSFPASIIGGIMWQQGLMMEVLLLPLLLEGLVAIPILFRIPDTLQRTP
jgi:MFS family permease